MVAGLRLAPSAQELEEAMLMEQQVAGRAGANLAALGGDSAVIASLSQPKVISWERLSEASAKDETVATLLALIQSGAPEQCSQWPESLRDFYTYRDVLTTTGSVVLYKDRPLIPSSLRQEVINLLHQGHQGVTAMASHAGQTVYWPGYNEDIIQRRLSCAGCDKVAPSQPAAPPTTLPVPEYPYQFKPFFHKSQTALSKQFFVFYSKI